MPRPNPVKACEDFHRTVNSQRDWESSLTRRHFLGLGLGAGVSIYAARALPLARMLEGAEAAAAAAPTAPILVTVFLPGGLDLLDSLVPLNQYSAYRAHRGALAQPQAGTPKLGSTGLGIHPSLTKGDGEGIKGLFDRGKLGFLPGIDYANPDLSHFHSRRFWETGLITASATTGWLGRWLDTAGAPDNPFQGLSSSSRLSPVIRSAKAPVASIEGVKSAELGMHGVSGANYDRAMVAFRDLAFARSRDLEGRAAVRNAARLTQDVDLRLRPYKDSAPAQPSEGGAPLPVIGAEQSTGYPADSPFADRLRTIAFLLAQPLGVRVATIDAEADFDTHDGQPGTLNSELAEISQSLAAFQADIEARGLGDRVLTFVWSEFGRRPKGNNSAGTDHGAGGIGWVQGVRAAGGIHSEYPSLTDLDPKANLKVTVDFRQVYASLLEQWLGSAAGDVIPNAGTFQRLTLVR